MLKLRRWSLACCLAGAGALVWALVATIAVHADWTTPASTAAAAPANDYPYPAAPDCDEGATASCLRDRWGFLQGQGTSWVVFRLNQANHVPFTMSYAGVRWGDASHWGVAAVRAGLKVRRVPERGSVAWYAAGQVAYVERVDSPTSIVISELNVDFHNSFPQVTIHPGPEWPTAFLSIDLHPRSTPEAPRPNGEVQA